MPKRPPLPRSEMEVARIVWELGNATVRQVLEALPEERNLDFKTVQTYLRRLNAKGYLCTRREGRSHVYMPCVRPSQVVHDVVEDLVDRLFSGESLPLVQHLIEARGFSDDEIEQLQEMLDQLKERKR
jgi:BlaI family penicillinase repressor